MFLSSQSGAVVPHLLGPSLVNVYRLFPFPWGGVRHARQNLVSLSRFRSSLSRFSQF